MWQEFISAEYGRSYWVNKQSGKAVWKRPEDAKDTEAAPEEKPSARLLRILKQ